ncbi:hypothetical protein MC885_011831 [Smutsia gigantea]|nr:hypothetical protein MC885_011831 [Smutsia gigantea]
MLGMKTWSSLLQNLSARSSRPSPRALVTLPSGAGVQFRGPCHVGCWQPQKAPRQLCAPDQATGHFSSSVSQRVQGVCRSQGVAVSLRCHRPRSIPGFGDR